MNIIVPSINSTASVGAPTLSRVFGQDNRIDFLKRNGFYRNWFPHHWLSEEYQVVELVEGYFKHLEQTEFDYFKGSFDDVLDRFHTDYQLEGREFDDGAFKAALLEGTAFDLIPEFKSQYIGAEKLFPLNDLNYIRQAQLNEIQVNDTFSHYADESLIRYIEVGGITPSTVVGLPSLVIM